VFSAVEGEEPKKQVDIDGVIDLLKKANISDPKQLEGKLQNAAGYQTIQSNLSKTEKRLATLEAENNELRNSINNPQRYNIDDMYGQEEPIEAKLERLLDARDRRKAERRRDMQVAQFKSYKKITGDKHYNVVKDAFNAKMQDPEVAYLINSGEMDAVEVYKNTVLDFYQDTAQRSLEALQAAKDSSSISPPNVESSARVPDRSQDTLTDKDKKVEQLRAKAKEGKSLHADERADLINSALGDFISK